MSIQPYQLYIERIDAARNMARYYALSIEPTLFGEMCLVRRWGRIGSRGQEKLQQFGDERQAVDLFLTIVRQKRRRGYRPKAVDIAGGTRRISQCANDKVPSR